MFKVLKYLPVCKVSFKGIGTQWAFDLPSSLYLIPLPLNHSLAGKTAVQVSHPLKFSLFYMVH